MQPEPEGGFSVFVPDLPSVATQGETIEEATEMAKEAIEAYLEVMREDGSKSQPSTASTSQSTAVLPREKDPGQALRLKMLNQSPLALVGLRIDLVAPFRHRRTQIIVVAQTKNAKALGGCRSELKFDLIPFPFHGRDVELELFDHWLYQ